MKKIIIISLAILLCFSLTSCKPGETDAREVLDTYLAALNEGSYEAAYDLLSNFDKTNITLDEFTEWRKVIAEIQKVNSSSVGTKVDFFKNYEYKGAQYKKAYGYLVTQQLEKAWDIEIGGYNAEEYHIMVGFDENEWKIALLVIDLPSVTAQYQRKLDDAKAAAQ
ncbi:MAG: hypothetical protein KBA53_12145 [Thermoclostridium sp.]|nr:hypothetical protein [Thermoclostridium sp.]